MTTIRAKEDVGSALPTDFPFYKIRCGSDCFRSAPYLFLIVFILAFAGSIAEPLFIQPTKIALIIKTA